LVVHGKSQRIALLHSTSNSVGNSEFTKLPNVVTSIGPRIECQQNEIMHASFDDSCLETCVHGCHCTQTQQRQRLFVSQLIDQTKTITE
jgi:hypothetical protein